MDAAPQSFAEAAPDDAVEVLAELTARASDGQPADLPPTLPLASIHLRPDLFQPRATNEQHIAELARAIGNLGAVEPVTVMQVGKMAVLIDGHHRIEAYSQAKRTDAVPVRYFKGTLEEAVLEAGRANSPTKLPMSNEERQDFGWRLVRLGRWSKREIARAASISEAQVAIMRRTGVQLGEGAGLLTSWKKARRAADGTLSASFTHEEVEVWKQEKADRIADELAKRFGTSLARDPEIAAMALATHFGRKLGEVMQELQGHWARDEEPPDQF